MASLRIVRGAPRLSSTIRCRIAPVNCRLVSTSLRSYMSNGSNRSNGYNHSNSDQESNSSNSKLVAALIGLGIVGLGTALAAENKDKPVDYDAVRKDIANILEQNPNYDDGSYGPLFVRLAWHAAGTYCKETKTGGSHGATMRFEPESKWGANAGLHIAREKLEAIKAKHPGISYADLWTLAGVVAIEEMGGPKIPWRPGRGDHPNGKFCPSDGRLPDAHKNQDHIRQIFYRMGFDDREIVALVGGGHAMGRCHTDRSGYEGPWTRAPTTFSNEFFRLLLEEKWTPRKWKGPLQYENSKSGNDLMMLPADLALSQDKEFRKYVELYAKDKDVFFQDFSKAFSKLLELGVPFPPKVTPPPPPPLASTPPAAPKKEKGFFAKLFG